MTQKSRQMIGWVVLDKHNVPSKIFTLKNNYFGDITNDSVLADNMKEYLISVDRDWCGLAPHRVTEIFIDENSV